MPKPCIFRYIPGGGYRGGAGRLPGRHPAHGSRLPDEAVSAMSYYLSAVLSDPLSQLPAENIVQLAPAAH